MVIPRRRTNCCPAGSLATVILFPGGLRRMDVMPAIGTGFGFCAGLLKT